MKRLITLMVIGMFVIVGFGTIAMGEPDDPVIPNRAPEAPVILKDKSSIQKQEYRFCFYAIDPDGDEVYYDISWNKMEESPIVPCEPDDPVTPWLGPFASGEEIDETRKCLESGDYELTIRAKDKYDNIGPSTTIIVTYTKAKVLQFPVINRLLARFPGIISLITKIFRI